MKNALEATDVIGQFELGVLFSAETLLKHLQLGICRRIAAGARVEMGEHGIRIEGFGSGREIDIREIERAVKEPSGAYEFLDVVESSEANVPDAEPRQMRIRREAREGRVITGPRVVGMKARR